jgi:hypothetical protein
MAQQTVQQVVLTGLNPSYAAAAGGGDSFLNDGNVEYCVKNNGGGSINAIFTPNGPSVGGQPLQARTVAVPAGEERRVGLFDPTAWNDANGLVQVTYSGVTSVIVAAIRSR